MKKMSISTGNMFTGQHAIFLNMKEDGKKIRANRIESKKAYRRKSKHSAKNYW